MSRACVKAEICPEPGVYPGHYWRGVQAADLWFAEAEGGGHSVGRRLGAGASWRGWRQHGEVP